MEAFILNSYKAKDIDLETALEMLADCGYCPNLLNDDNGLWALTFMGYQNVNTGKTAIDITTTFFVKKKYWKKSPRKAILFALKDLQT